MRGWFKKMLGNRGERRAAKMLKRKGYRILARQHTNRYGEIDLIARDGDSIVFVEVKTRSSRDAGHPVEAVTAQKQKKLTQVALAYLKRRRLLEHRARFDVVTVVWPEDACDPDVEHIENAFEPVGEGQMFS